MPNCGQVHAVSSFEWTKRALAIYEPKRNLRSTSQRALCAMPSPQRRAELQMKHDSFKQTFHSAVSRDKQKLLNL